MANYKTTDTELISIATAIREKAGISKQLIFPTEFVSEIANMSSDANIEPLEVTENGTYNPPSGIDGYAPIIVNVSGGGSSNKFYGENDPASDLGSNGDLYFKGIPVQYDLRADDGYIVFDVNTVLSIHSTTFKKINIGPAIAVEGYGTNGYYGPVLISYDLEFVLYTGNTTSDSYTSVIIDDQTWYVCGYGYWNRNGQVIKNIPDYYDPRYPLPSGATATLTDWVTGVLEACHASLTPLSNSIACTKIFVKKDGVWVEAIGQIF